MKPTQCLMFLGFKIDSVNMQVFLTDDKKTKPTQVFTEITGHGDNSIRQVVGLVGLRVAYALAVEYAGIHFKSLE